MLFLRLDIAHPTALFLAGLAACALRHGDSAARDAAGAFAVFKNAMYRDAKMVAWGEPLYELVE